VPKQSNELRGCGAREETGMLERLIDLEVTEHGTILEEVEVV
jgi:hypothetical protein